MNAADAEAFARRWVDEWNRLAVDEIVGHYHPRGRFTSPIAARVVGDPVLPDREALQAYWSKAAGRIASLRFDYERILWDPARRELCVIYWATIDGSTKRACEFMRFDENGRILEGEAMYGAEVTRPA